MMHQSNKVKLSSSLSAQLLVKVFGYYLIVAMFITLIHMWVEFNNQKSAVQQELQQLENTLRPGLNVAVYNMDFESLKANIAGYISITILEGISVKNEYDDILARIGNTQMSHQTSQSEGADKSSTVFSDILSDTIMFQFDLVDPIKEEKIGSVFLYSNERVVFNRVKYGFLYIIINSLIKSAALWLIFLFISRNMLNKPLRELARQTSKIRLNSLKDSKISIQTEKKNELKTIEKAFNYMLDNLIKSLDEKEQAQKQLESLNEVLEQKVAARTQALESSNAELKQLMIEFEDAQKQLILKEKMSSLVGLIAGVAHEINTPLSIVITGTSIVHDKLTDLNQHIKDNRLNRKLLTNFISASYESIDLMESNLNRTSFLLNKFKEVAIALDEQHYECFNVKLQLEHFALFTTKSECELKHVTLNCDCDDDLEFTTYPLLFNQIIVNLVMNSLTHAYGEKQAGNIFIDIKQTEEGLKIIFADDGKGVPEALKQRIFDPFFTTRRSGGNTGLGLHIVYNIIANKMGGDIELIDNPDTQSSGCCFVITLPTLYSN